MESGNGTNVITLLPCPFCGGVANLVEADLGAKVVCIECGAETGYHMDFFGSGYTLSQNAIEHWNTRAVRTCHDANTRFNAWTCSECKCTQLLMFDDYGEPTLSVDGVASVPNYCPNCGAKVVK